MKKFLTTTLCSLIAVVIMVSTFPPSGNTKILDPTANNPLLRRIAGDLHRQGIDVIQDWNSEVPVRRRPVVAPLANYQISLVSKEEGWMSEFNKGLTGAIAAIKTSENIAHDGFAQKWSNTPKRLRVFLSFAREDVAYARNVKTALEAQGYVAFIYISDQAHSPAQSPVMLGEFLRTAGTHLVIDTDTARRKSGVLAEALAYAKYKTRSSNVFGPGIPPTRSAPEAKHVVEIYGAKRRCPRTKQAIELFQKAGAVVKYYDVDTNPRAQKVVDKNTKYLLNGELLPFIRVDGKPIHATSPGVRDALMVCEQPIP